MKRVLAGLALLLSPYVASAQYIQEEYTADYSLRTLLTKQSDTHYLFQAMFHNEQQFEPNRIYGITQIRINNVFPYSTQGQNPRRDTNLGSSEVGSVFMDSLPSTFPGNDTLRISGYTFNGQYYNDANVGGFGTDSPYFSGGYGLLGCSIPAHNFAGGGPSTEYSGSTCAAAGYTGWKAINIGIEFVDPTPDFTGSDISVRLIGYEQNLVAYNLAPEPGTWVMLGFGLAGIFAVRRKTRAV